MSRSGSRVGQKNYEATHVFFSIRREGLLRGVREPMSRRHLITLLGSAVTWPFSARAQPPPPMPVIGFLNSGFPAERASFVAAFRQGLKEIGYVEGQTGGIGYIFAEG